MMTTRERSFPAYAIAAVLFLDGLVHLSWAAGLTWPASSSRSLYLAVLAFDVPFRPPLLVGLAAAVWAAAGVVLLRARCGRTGLAGRLAQAGTAVFTSAVLLRALLGGWWLFAMGSLPATFWWLNLFVYTPLCAALAGLGLRLLSSPDPAAASPPAAPSRRRLRRVLSAQAATVAMPVLVVAALLAAAFGDSPRAQAQYSPQQQLGAIPSRYLDTPLARFHYIRAGSGSTVVLLSPGSAWLRAWLPQFRALARAHTVYAVDLPGQGFTRLHDPAAFRFDLADMTRAIGGFLDAAGLRTVALAGNSWSGGWALAYAQLRPRRVSSLVLLAPSGLAQPDPLSWELLKLPLVGRALTNVASGSRAMVRYGLDGLFVHRNVVSPSLVDAMWAPNTFPDNLRADYGLEQNLDWAQTERALPMTRQRTLVIWGRQDGVLPAAQAARFGQLMPRATVRVLGGCGHALTLDCPGRVTSLMEGFWRNGQP